MILPGPKTEASTTFASSCAGSVEIPATGHQPLFVLPTMPSIETSFLTGTRLLQSLLEKPSGSSNSAAVFSAIALPSASFNTILSRYTVLVAPAASIALSVSLAMIIIFFAPFTKLSPSASVTTFLLGFFTARYTDHGAVFSALSAPT